MHILIFQGDRPRGLVPNPTAEANSASMCGEFWTFCLPLSNTTWIQNNEYQFVWNKNHSFFMNNRDAEFDIHLVTLSTKTERRTIKSWFNLSSTDESLAVNVTDDWFPHTLPNTAPNRTWTMYAFLLGHDPVEPLSDPTSFKLNADASNTAYVSIQVVQTPPKFVVVSKEHFPERWKIALIVVAIVVVIIALCIIIWLYKNMQKEKKKAAKAKADAEASPQSTPNNNMNSKMHSSILSTPDALMIADTFRQVMSTSDIDKHRNQVGEDLLKRQLESEGTSVSEVERRTSSTKQKAGYHY
ncbi:hypothetical protein V8B55DRAFT_1589751 [Mucor lusitanicus]